ncbi:MAG: hypothetical protein HY579_08555 [Nitrospinae bacterium]|nr:hypothetical protein [Nitrospinota bacterium]
MEIPYGNDEKPDVEKIMFSIRSEVVADLLKQRRRTPEIPEISHGVPLPDLGSRSRLFRALASTPPFKQAVFQFLKLGRALFYDYNKNNRAVIKILTDEIDRQNYVVNYLLEALVKNKLIADPSVKK